MPAVGKQLQLRAAAHCQSRSWHPQPLPLRLLLLVLVLQVLGTFITEWDLGASRCRRMFASKAAAQAVADQLVALAVHYGFEGWLINIENSLSRSEVQVRQLAAYGLLLAVASDACNPAV